MGDSCNRDNFIGDRSSTRTYHASAQHHSKSQWSLGWSEPETVSQSVSSNRFANGSNQNCGNVISDRSTTRLHAPPGGHTSDIFGTGLGQTRAPAPRNTNTQPATSIPSAPVPEPVAANRFVETRTETAPVKPALVAQKPVHVPSPKRGTSANVFANGSNQNSGNFITDRPTSRVLAPPGGRSNITFG